MELSKASAKMDDVIVGEHAVAWKDIIGLYGDPLRMVLINKLVARALDHFGGSGGRRRIAEPTRLIQQSIAQLPITTTARIDAQASKLVAAHEDAGALTSEFPFLRGTTLLDLGSGTGYLGGWLATLGVRYVGVEPSLDLDRVARSDPRLASARLVQATIRDFCERDEYPHAEPPTLISIIGVIDHLGEPQASLSALFDFMSRRDWLNVPLLITTFDPDFFLPGLPTQNLVLQTSAPYGVTETRNIRDPAFWEETFASGGFHLLEQRPLHISGLPEALGLHLQAMFKRQFEECGGQSRPDEAGGTKAHVPPRQGPFYFWLLCPRKVAVERGCVGDVIEPFQLEYFAEEETLSVIGNIGPRVYRVLQGNAFYDSPETGRMTFGEKALFGQFETSGNYVSSRVLGTLKAGPGTRLATIESRQILRELSMSHRYHDELFLSLLRHLESVQFKPFVSAKRMDDRASAVLTGGNHNWRFVRNVAASLLQAGADAVPEALSGRYRSRILVELGEDKLCGFVYGPDFKREGSKLTKILPTLVQANVIDCFSANIMERSGAHRREISEFGDVDKREFNPLHIGWQTARYIDHHFPRPDAEGNGDDLYTLALAVSAFYGSESGRSEFEANFAEINGVERRLRACLTILGSLCLDDRRAADGGSWRC